MFVLIILICMGIFGFATSWVPGTPRWLKGAFGVLLAIGVVINCCRIAAITKSVSNATDLNGHQQIIRRS